jgi:hypothetical protein
VSWERRAPRPMDAVFVSFAVSNQKSRQPGADLFQVLLVVVVAGQQYIRQRIPLQLGMPVAVEQLLLRDGPGRFQQPQVATAPALMHLRPGFFVLGLVEPGIRFIRVFLPIAREVGHLGGELRLTTEPAGIQPGQGDLLPALQVRDHVLDRPVEVERGGRDLPFTQAGEKLLPAMELLAHRCQDVFFHVHD